MAYTIWSIGRLHPYDRYIKGDKEHREISTKFRMVIGEAARPPLSLVLF